MSNNKSVIKGIGQGRAKCAYDCANKISKDLKNIYSSHVKSFPMLVKTNGLGASLAFLFSKKDKEKGVYREVGDSIVTWLKMDEKYKNYGLKTVSDLKSLLDGVVQLNSQEYHALTIEVLAFFNWLRRFSEGLKEED
ncbi:MAG: type III-B CRISPR module-associated protein Cmr5 [Methanosarcinales archaeon]|jgi:CRISPR-associated protein Cmr5|nr:type III-B CRISPR module-associated protein Cmr5 [Methanosarcinales archaeon]